MPGTTRRLRLDKVKLDFGTITQRMDQMIIPAVDHIIGIATGGIVPASLLAYRLHCSFSLIKMNYRDSHNNPQRPEPLILENASLPQGIRHILLVDDVSVSGQTLAIARLALQGYQITTFVLKGQADLVVFPEISTCVAWPWKLE
jgi:hypoxanthine phosphoribosyltransferase